MSALFLAWPAAAESPPPAPPDPEFLEFLGELGGEDEAFVRFLEMRQAESALERVEEEVEDDDDE